MIKRCVLIGLFLNALAILIMQVTKFEGVWYFIISYWALSTFNNFLALPKGGRK